MKKMIDGVLLDLSEQEIAEFNAPVSQSDAQMFVRSERDYLLTSSDVYALADRITPEWTAYRKALRDVTDQAGFPYSVVWPTKP
jgi:hypothetical protein